MSVPDYAEFKRALKTAIARHFTKLSTKLSRNRCNGYSLYSSDDVPSIGPVANRSGALKVKPGHSEYAYYRFSVDEWSEWEDWGLFDSVNALIRQYSKADNYLSKVAPRLLALCSDALAESKKEGVFTAAARDLFLVVWVCDSSNSMIQESAARLNPPKAYRAFATEFVDSQDDTTGQDVKACAVTDRSSSSTPDKTLSDAEIKAMQAMSEAIRAGDARKVLSLIGKGKSLLKAMTPFGTWLHMAAKAGHLEIVRELVTLGVDVNRRGGVFGGNALNLAASYGHLEITKFLLDHGAEFDMAEPIRNPLFGAIRCGNLEIVKLLVKRGIDTKVAYPCSSSPDLTALEFARERGHRKIAAFLADK